MTEVYEALRRLEKAADRILGRQKRGTKSWVSEIRQPNNENYAIAVITTSPDSTLFQWQVIVVDRGRKILGYEGVTENLEEAKEKVKNRVENLYIWSEPKELIWNPPLETANEAISEALKGYRRWKVDGYLIVMSQLSGNKIEVQVVDPVKRIIYHRNVGDLSEENKLFGEALEYVGKRIGRTPQIQQIN